MIKTVRDYEGYALRTIKPHDSKQLAIADWALGLGGELGEVVELVREDSPEKMELAKELGDILWYAVALGKEVDVEIAEDIFASAKSYIASRVHCPSCLVDENPSMTAMIKTTVLVGGIQEKIKHAIMHKEATDYSLVKKLLEAIIVELALVAHLNDFDITDVATLNAAKLAHRYNVKNGGAYSHEASANRHAAEVKFEDTRTYKVLYTNITKNVVEFNADDVEVL